MLEEIDIPNDPYFLWKYRSFHNHEMDCNLIAGADQIKPRDLHRKGAFNAIPETYLAI